jgi:FkbM family methyltransferase
MNPEFKHQLRSAIKPFVPRAVKNGWNQAKYAWLWRHRKTVSFDRDGQRIVFSIVNPRDLIQNVQGGRKFYEEYELINISKYFPRGGVFVDVGANTGQHAIFAAKFMGANKLILFEPIVEAYRILLENLRLNQLEQIADISYLGIGLSDRDGCATFDSPLGNLGGTSLTERRGGRIKITTGDRLLSNARVDFIKIDTEGFEIKVLDGFARTIQRQRPAIFVEVDNLNMEAFESLISLHDYEIVFSSRRYSFNENFLIIPKSQRVRGDAVITE